MIDLLAPSALAAFAALALPILVHLVRRSERRRLSFAALRWVDERTRPRKRLRLHERWLLALRLLLLALLALLLALPVWRAAGKTGMRWVVVSPELDADAVRAAIAQPLAEWRWLASGFPPLDEAPPPADAFASRVRQLDVELPSNTALTLVVPAQLAGLDAERLRLGHAIDWRVLPATVATKADAPPPPPHIAVRHDADGEAEAAVVRALEKAWELEGAPDILDVAKQDTPIAADTRLLFWLAPTPDAALDAWVRAGGTALVSRSALKGQPALSDDDGQAVLQEVPLGRGRILALATALTPETTPALRDADVAARLRKLLLPTPPAPDRALAAAIKPVARTAFPGPATSLENGFALVAALLFFLERALATRARRPPA